MGRNIKRKNRRKGKTPVAKEQKGTGRMHPEAPILAFHPQRWGPRPAEDAMEGWVWG